jgi:hypothetical protein
VTLSASSVSTYLDCHLQWYFTYIEKREEPPDERREVGLEVHDFAEVILKGGIPVDEAGPCGICEVVPHSPQCPKAGDEVSRLVDVFIDDIYPTYGEPVLIEAAFELDVDGVEYTGFIDSVDFHEPSANTDRIQYRGVLSQGVGPAVIEAQTDHLFGKVILRDLKTTRNRPRAGKYRDPLIGYYLGARELGYPADTLLLDYIVRTRRPYYWPEEQPVPDDDEIDIWAGQVLRVHHLIEEGDWEPTGVGSWVCSWCPWKDICGPYERWSDMTSPIREDAR